MGVSIQGIDRLIGKLSKISMLETRETIDEIGKDVSKNIRNEAKKFSKKEYESIGVAEGRKYGLSYYLDVGLKNDKVPFENWKGLYFHNYGYWNRGWNFNGEKYIDMHAMWFDNAVKNMEKEIKTKIKRKVKEQFKAFKE